MPPTFDSLLKVIKKYYDTRRKFLLAGLWRPCRLGLEILNTAFYYMPSEIRTTKNCLIVKS